MGSSLKISTNTNNRPVRIDGLINGETINNKPFNTFIKIFKS